MKMPASISLLAALLTLTWSPSAGAQEAPVISVPFEGTEAFGHILHSFNLAPVATLDDAANLPPNRTLIVIFGDLQAFETSHKGFLASFRDRGGALLLASDYRAQINLSHDRTYPDTISVDGSQVLATDASIYRDHMKACPVVKANDQFPIRHTIFRDLTKGLATNRPSFLRAKSKLLDPLAQFAEDCRYVDGSGDHKLPERAAYIFSTSDIFLERRVVIVAGQGVFLNGMLIQKDNDNFTFTWNTIQWLALGPNGPRQHALFIDQGKVVDQFALPLSRFGPMPIPPLRIINHMLRALEDENVFNRFLVEHIGKEPYLRIVVILGSLVALILGAWRFMNGRFRLDTRVPLLISKQQTTPAPMPVLWLRQEELHRLGNFWEPAQVLARQFFLDHAGLTVPLWDADAQPPPLETSANFWERRKLTRQVRQLWELARSSPAQAVSARQFDNLLRLLAEAATALAAGRARFIPPDIAKRLGGTL